MHSLYDLKYTRLEPNETKKDKNKTTSKMFSCMTTETMQIY